MTTVTKPTYTSQQRHGKLTVTATATVPTDMQTVMRAHADPLYAPAFRDIGKYVLFERDGHVLRTAYASRVGPMHVPMAVNKCVSANEGTVDFWTAPSSMAAFRGRWTVTPAPGGGTHLHFHQTLDVPVWARFLPIESSVRDRVCRAIEDTARLSEFAPAAHA